MTRSMSAIAKLVATIVLVVLCSLTFALATENKTAALLDDIKKYETCVLKCVFSFYFPEYSPPRTPNEFKTMCRRQSEGFKCIKERTKGAAPLIKRGLLTMVGTRQRQHKKLCSHPDSEHSKKFIAASKCLMEKRLEPLRENDMKIAMTHAEILRRNYNDSTAELKQICCSLYNYKKGFYDIANDGCPGHKAMLEELIESIVTKDTSLVCDDDEKLASLCPQLAPLKPSNSSNVKAQSSVSTVLYLMATLGEPNEGLPVLN